MSAARECSAAMRGPASGTVAALGIRRSCCRAPSRTCNKHDRCQIHNSQDTDNRKPQGAVEQPLTAAKYDQHLP
jgi:hypothetical protein